MKVLSMDMKRIDGRGVSGGIAIGKLAFYSNASNHVQKYHIDNIQAELERYRMAMKQAQQYIGKLYNEAQEHMTKNESEIFQTHIMILQDSKFVIDVEEMIDKHKINAEYAVKTVTKELADIFKSLDDEYLRARYTDILDAANTLITILQNREHKIRSHNDEPIIVAAKELMPSETISLNKNALLGIVTNEGSVNSHTSILARTLELPSVTQIDESLEDYDGMMAIVDGQLGRVYINPDESTMNNYVFKKKRYYQHQEQYKMQVGKPSQTKDGKRVVLSANIGLLDDIPTAKKNDAEGVGLFRSEYLFLHRDSAPTEEEQFEAYKKVLSSFKKNVVISIADLGGDKRVGYLDMPTEKNPAIGYKGIRVGLSNKELLTTQLRALYRASVYGRLRILLTMINNLNEIDYVKRCIEDVKAELRAEGKQYNDNVQLGAMIETPAAAIIADEITQMVDFVSIGTNDLAQYTLAIDRSNQKLEYFYEPYHKSLLRLIKYVTDCAHKNHIWVSICGELASDPNLIADFMAVGIDELSMIPSRILRVREIVRSTDTRKPSKFLPKLYS